MRFRFQNKKKNGNTHGKMQTRFAWLPVRLSNGTWVWLEKYRLGPPRPRGRSADNVVHVSFDADQDQQDASLSGEVYDIRRSA